MKIKRRKYDVTIAKLMKNVTIAIVTIAKLMPRNKILRCPTSIATWELSYKWNSPLWSWSSFQHTDHHMIFIMSQGEPSIFFVKCWDFVPNGFTPLTFICILAFVFLAVHRQLYRIHCLSVCPTPTNNQILHDTKEWPKRIVTFETFDQSDEKTRPDPKRPTYLRTYSPTYLPTLWHNTILQTCDNWDTDYNSYNWEPKFMTIFVTWQLRVTLDSIRNSCDVYIWRGP